MNFWIIAASVFCVFVLTWCGSKNTNDALVLMQESIGVSWVEKIEMLQQAYLLDTSNPDIIKTLAQEAMKQEMYEIADQNYTRLERIAWHSDEGWLWKIEIALLQWNEAVASSIIEEVYSPWDLTSERLVSLGSLYYANNFLLEASTFFEQAITADVTNVKARTNMWVVQADLWELEMAKQFMNEASKLDPSNTTIQFNKATLLGDLAFVARKEGTESTLYVVEAIEILDKLIEQDPMNQQVQIYKAVVLFENADFEKSEEILMQVTTNYPENPEAWYYLWLVLKELWKNEKAENAFLEVLTIDTSHPWAAQELIDLGIE